MIRTVVMTVSLWVLSVPMPPSTRAAAQGGGPYTPDQYWVGQGQGDLTKGGAVCRRVAELSARADLAKQIRVLIKERLVDRVRERSGRDPEQDIELVREEIVEEYLKGVTIVDYHVDEEKQACFATAVMPKQQPDQE
ncbi:MAG: hypothetical protein NZM29_01955 [Nitrospira sp.]|nr:hypothetical protein [Nitrospira sp.]